MAYQDHFPGTSRDGPYTHGEPARAGTQRRLLPHPVANSIIDALRFALGAALFIVLALAWASLASWSLADPSLSHVTSTPARNLLGVTGAVTADLLIQTFGVAVLVLLLPPMFWAAALLKREPLPRAIARSGFWVVAVVCAAIAGSSVPAPSAWPLHHGLGGIIGDALMRLVSAPFVLASSDYGRPGVGVVMMLVAGWAIIRSIGLARSDLNALGSTSWLPAWRRLGPRQRASMSADRAQTSHGERHDPSHRVEPTLPLISTEASSVPMPQPTGQAVGRYGPYAAYEAEPDPNYDDHDDDEFDSWTNATSRSMAGRFAASANAPHALQDMVQGAFGHALPLSTSSEDAQAVEAPYEVLPAQAPPVTRGSALTRAITKPAAYKRPSLNLLDRPRTARATPQFAASVLRGTARLLEDGLAEFGVIGTVVDITPGPVVTLYTFEPARGTNLARVIALAGDVARLMGLGPVRISPVPGRPVLGIELPNQARETVYLRDMFDAEAYRSTMDVLPVALGRSATGEPIIGCLTRMPQVLMTGAAGAGKTVGLNAIILSLLYKHGPDNCRFLMIDPKMMELSVYDGIPHLLTPVVTDPHKAITALAWCVREMEERYKRMAGLGVRTIDVFNNRVRNARKRGERLGRTVQTGFDPITGKATTAHEEMNLEPMPYIVIVIEEFSGLMAVAGREIEGSVKRLAEAARAAGIHLVMATERPTTDIVTGALKENMPTRMAYKVASRTDSRVVLGVEGAEQLLGAGDMLYMTGAGLPVRLQGPYVSSAEVEIIADSLRQQGAPAYVEGLTRAPEEGGAPSGGGLGSTGRPATHRATTALGSDDALYDRAVAIVVRDGRTSAAHLGRRLNMAPAWAESLLARLQSDGVVSAPGPDGVCILQAGIAA